MNKRREFIGWVIVSLPVLAVWLYAISILANY